jgi:hypothetical protein
VLGARLAFRHAGAGDLTCGATIRPVGSSGGGRGFGGDPVLLPRVLLEVAARARSGSAREELGLLSTLVEERGVCPFCGALLTEDRDPSCPNPACRHLSECGRTFVRSLG